MEDSNSVQGIKSPIVPYINCEASVSRDLLCRRSSDEDEDIGTDTLDDEDTIDEDEQTDDDNITEQICEKLDNEEEEEDDESNLVQVSNINDGAISHSKPLSESTSLPATLFRVSWGRGRPSARIVRLSVLFF